MGILKVIEYTNSRDNIVEKYNIRNDYITKGSKLIVREGQAAIFCDKGRMADVFLPGTYTLSTDNVPLLTKMMSWKYGFESPFKSDIYFVNTTQITNLKWGTLNAIMVRDADYGALRIRAYGTYAFKIDDPYVFMQEISGTLPSFDKKEITDYLRSIIITNLTDAIGEAKIPVLDMAGNLLELSAKVKDNLSRPFEKLGLILTGFNFENFSLPENLEKAIDESTALGILGKNMDVYTAKAQADALRDAAKNEGSMGGAMGAGIGMSMGMNMGGMFGKMSETKSSSFCPNCGAEVRAGAKFCGNCGHKVGGATCPKCGSAVKPGARFCSNCGAKI